MEIKLPTIVRECIDKIGNKTSQRVALDIWAALYVKSKYSNSDGYFPVPSGYLREINNRYSRIIKVFIDKGFIDYYKRVETGVFTEKKIKYYSTYKHICMKYKFLIDLESADKVEIDFKSKVRKRWFDIVKNSLIERGYEPKISRDGFGLRVHHSAIKNYKKDFKDCGFGVIDAKSSHPTLLWLMLKDEGIFDKNYMNVFESGKDFYTYLSVSLGLGSRQEAKDLFMFWTNGDGYVPEYKIHLLFPEASKYIRRKKENGYKDMNSYLQRVESKMWIDDILENLPVEFGLPIHDSIIVKIQDIEQVYQYIFNKYTKMNFSITYL